MTNKLIDKSASVLVVDSANGTRQMMTSVLRAAGYSEVVGAASLDEASGIFSKMPIDWLITSLFAEDRVNALNVLQAVREHESLAALKVTLFLTDSEAFALPRAFALGLFTYGSKPFTQVEFSAAMGQIFARLEECNGNETLVSAAYLREFLRSRDDKDGLLRFEKALHQTFPLEHRLLLDLARAHFEKGEDQRARSLLWQLCEQDAKMTARAQSLSDQYLGTDSSLNWDAASPGVVVIIDPDQAAAKATQEALKQGGALNVEIFADGEACWQWFQENPDPDLIVMEWKIPKITGPQLLQRIRSSGRHLPTILINSSLVAKKHQPLLEEMGVTSVVPKPTRRADLLNAVAWAMAQNRQPTEEKALEHKIRALLASKRMDEALELLKLFVAKVGPADARCKHLEAEVAFQAGDFVTSRDRAKESLALGNKSVVTLNLLGKALMQLREFTSAMQVFERANEISPESLERLCSLAETKSELGQEEAARDTLAQAKLLDPKNQAVVNTTVSMAIARGDAATAEDLMSKTNNSTGVLAFVNNRAVAYSKAIRFKEAIDLYGKALGAIPEKRPELKAIILYNRALAEVQGAEPKLAMKSLKGIGSAQDPALRSKVKSLLARLEEAEKTGQPVRLNQGIAPVSLSEDGKATAPTRIDQIKVRSNSQAARPQFCCLGIYTELGEPGHLVEALMATPLRLNVWRAQKVESK